MKEENDFIKGGEEDTREIIRRYEGMLRSNAILYFDVYEFENIIEYYLGQQSYTDAGRAIEIARQQHPYSTDLQLKQAEILVAQNKLKEAVDQLDLLSRIENSNSQVLFLQGKVLVGIGNPTKGVDYFNMLLNLTVENRIETIEDITAVLLDAGEAELALPFLEIAVSEDPDNENLWFDIAYCYDRLDKVPEAIKAYTRYLDFDPFNDSAWYNLGLIYSRESEHEKALDAFEYAVAINDDMSIYLLSLAHTYASLENYPKAISLFDEMLENDENNTSALCSIGECYEKLEKWEVASAFYEKTIILDPENSEAYFGLAVVLMETGKLFESLAHVKKALKYDEVNSEYWYGLGKIYHKLGSNKEAIEAYQKALELEEDDVDSMAGLAYIYLETGEKELAYTRFLSCIEMAPEAEFLVQAAILEYRKGQKNKAIDHVKKAIALDAEVGNKFFCECPEAKEIIDHI
jgi:Tetratricopeptide repeat./Bacterial transcriptional activator domain.